MAVVGSAFSAGAAGAGGALTVRGAGADIGAVEGTAVETAIGAGTATVGVGFGSVGLAIRVVGTSCGAVGTILTGEGVLTGTGLTGRAGAGEGVCGWSFTAILLERAA